MTTVSTDTENTSWAMWQSWLSTDTTFCRALVGCGYLSEEQMQRAAGRYRLGRSHDGGVIFWQIDQKGVVRDGKIMYYREDCHRDKARNPSWVSARMKAYYGYDGSLPVERCLFGLHLLSEKGAVAIVEAEKTAVIMSERFPQYIWMAAGGLSALSAEKLRYAEYLGAKYIRIYGGNYAATDTDPDGKTYERWKAIAAEASRHTLFPVYVSPLLELQATPEQKAAKIDIVDYLYNLNP